jgi:uncharacterized protein
MLSLGIGAAVAALFLVAGYGAELLALHMMSDGPSLRLGFQGNAILPNTALQGGIAFGALLIGGHVLNSFMEESLFRGLMISHFLLRMSFARANVLQASLFGLWHVVWPLRAWMDGDMNALAATAAALIYIARRGLQDWPGAYCFAPLDRYGRPLQRIRCIIPC